MVMLYGGWQKPLLCLSSLYGFCVKLGHINDVEGNYCSLVFSSEWEELVKCLLMLSFKPFKRVLPETLVVLFSSICPIELYNIV